MGTGGRAALLIAVTIAYLVVGAIVIGNHNAPSAPEFPIPLLRAQATAMLDATVSGRDEVCGLDVPVVALDSTSTADIEVSAYEISEMTAVATCLEQQGYLEPAELATVTAQLEREFGTGWSGKQIVLYTLGVAALIAAMTYVLFWRGRRTRAAG